MFNLNNKKRFISGIVLFLLIFNLVGVGFPKKAEAGLASEATQVMQARIDAVRGVFDKVWQAWEKAEAKLIKNQKHWAAVAFKATLHQFLKSLAVDTATWVATGDKGQKPMFITQGWGAYLEDAADQAAGTFIMTAADSWDSQDHYDQDLYSECLDGIDHESLKDRCLGGEGVMEECYDQLVQEEIDNCQEGLDLSSNPTVGNAGRNYSKGTVGSIVNFLCEPDVRVKLRIAGGLASIERPRTPKCTMSEARKNWDEFVNDPNFLQNFQTYWDPWENDVGIALTMHSSFLDAKIDSADKAKKEREEGGGWKAVQNLAGDILTPSSVIRGEANRPLEESSSYAEVTTGNIVADALGTFADTLMGKLIDKWMTKGMANLSGSDDENSYSWGGFDNGTSATRAQDNKNPIKKAKEKYLDVFQTEFDQGSAYSVLSKLMMCPDPQNSGPEECVIDENFSTAVQEKLTVQEAIDGGYINTEVPFGFITNGLEPEYNQGYPYRSLIILRKYRVIPVGWELAAGYIAGQGTKTYNIQELIDEFDNQSSPFYKLIDPDWVLKAPELFCSAEGYGEKLVDEQITDGQDFNDDGDYVDTIDETREVKPRVIVSRNKYCADERSCIKEDDNGNCLFYGYCSEEKREWNFNGETCEPHFNSCQRFVDPSGGESYYVKQTLEYNGCTEENAGCQWYCVSGDLAGEGWMCTEPEVNRVVSGGSGFGGLCTDPDGCELVDTADFDKDGDILESCIVPFRGISCELGGSKATLFTIDSFTQNNTAPNGNNDIYLDSDTKECSNRDEGCHEYIRTKPNLGTNLIKNPSFEGFDVNEDGEIDWGEERVFWSFNGAINNDNSYLGNNSFNDLGGYGLAYQEGIDTGYGLANRKFILSFYANGTCDTSLVRFFGSGAGVGSDEIALEDSGNWQRYSVALAFPYNVPSNITNLDVNIGFYPNLPSLVGGIAPGCVVDAVKLEEVSGLENSPSNYTGYQENNLLYLKKSPDYYECEKYVSLETAYSDKESCEVDDGSFRLWRNDIDRCVTGGSPKCEDFAFECSNDDIGCDLYTPANGDPPVPAVVASNDFCPEECNGYDTYKQENTFFESEKFPEFLIPDNEKKCSAQYAGCTEFTNLDQLEQGGEAIEHYTYLRPCQEIDDTCNTFYTWVGSEVSGFQLRAFLLRDDDGTPGPDSIFNPAIFDVTELFGDCVDFEDAISNPECYEFYTELGEIYYHHYKDTMACSDDCHPFRKTESTQTDCENSWGLWRGDDGENPSVDPYFCIYDGLPEESISCPASQNNCYEYKGNASNDIRKVIDDDFEQAENLWGTGILSGESLIRGGHSLQINNGNTMSYDLKLRCNLGPPCADENGCECQIDGKTVCYLNNGEQTCIYRDLIRQGKAYLLFFWAKGSGSISAQFSSAAPGDEFATGDISLSQEWAQYSLGPVFIHDDWDMSSDDPGIGGAGSELLEALQISGFGGISYIDNIILKEVSDYMFLIRPDIWNIPLACDQDYNGAQAPQYMLGCKEYKSQIDKATVYLKSFDHLCSEDVVGCEALIDTHNFNLPMGRVFNPGDISEITISEDSIVSLVNNERKTCNSQDKGCTALGEAFYRYDIKDTPEDRSDDTDDLYQYETRYIINDPNKYDETLCQGAETGCNEFDSLLGKYHFKDPLSGRIKSSPKTCQYKTGEEQVSAGWYINGTTSGAPNCPTNFSDIGVTYAYGSCSSGSRRGRVCADDDECPGGKCLNWTGECPSSEDTCTEYIDPLSTISSNMVFNGDFSQDVDENSIPDGWGQVASYYSLDEPIFLEYDTLYTIMGDVGDNTGTYEIELTNCTPDFDSSDALTSPDDSLTISNIAGGTALLSLTNGDGQFSGRFYASVDTSCRLVVNDNLADNGSVAIYETGVYYNLDNSINKTACNGLIDYGNGCVLFNSREIQNNGILNDIIYDADLDSETPLGTDTTEVPPRYDDSNLLVKVRPDRDCGEWLYCESLVKTEDSSGNERSLCLEVGLCDSLDENGLCNGFPVTEKVNQTLNTNELKNKSGFAKIGRDWGGGEIIPGYYPFETMNQSGGKVIVPNGGFETISSNGIDPGEDRPVGWNYERGTYASHYFSLITDPITSQRAGVGVRAPEGNSFLKIDADGSAVSEKIDINFFDEDQSLTTYFLGAQINTNYLFDGEAFVNIRSYGSDGLIIAEQTVIRQSYGIDWQYLTDYFMLSNSANRIDIEITGSDGAEGAFYIDDITIRPALNVNSPSAFVDTGISVDSWTLQESIDPVLGNCGNEGTRNDITIAVGNWDIPPSAGTAYGFGSNKDTLNGTGGAYDGMLVSNTITLPDDASTLHLWRNVKIMDFDYHGGNADSYNLEIRDPSLNSVLLELESWEASEDGGGDIPVTGWTLEESIDPDLGLCGEPPGSGAEGTRNDITLAAFDWDVPPSGGTAYGFGSDKDTLNGMGGAYDGMLVSNTITLPDDPSTLHLWRNVKMRSFDEHTNTPDSYYLEIRDPNDIEGAALRIIEMWESDDDDLDRDFLSNEISYAIPSDLFGQEVVITMQLVGHANPSDCEDGGGDDALAQIGNVYITYDSPPVGEHDMERSGNLGYDISALAGQDVRIAMQLVGHSGVSNCTDGIDEDALAQIGDVSIMSRDLSEKYVNQSCRAYPKSDSLSCDYFDDKGIKNIGWKGYCLEYDRAPGNPDQCLMWWPVDLLLGEGSNEEEIGYRGKYPVYYGAGSQVMSATVNNIPMFYVIRGQHGNTINVPLADFNLDGVPWYEQDYFFTRDKITQIVLDTSHGVITLNNANDWWGFVSNCGDREALARECQESPHYTQVCSHGRVLIGEVTWDGDSFSNLEVAACDWSGSSSGGGTAYVNSVTVYLTIPYISELVQVVTPFGNNKYWADRVYTESDYVVPTAGYIYDDYSEPFGSFDNLFPDNDPEQWSLSYIDLALTGNDFLLGKSWAGMAGDNSHLSRIFAQSYGHWGWNGLTFEETSGNSWDPPDNICNGNPPNRPEYNPTLMSCNGGDCFSGCNSSPTGSHCDWCGVPPVIENVKLNNQSSGNYVINNSGTVNFTFNSIVDINQSPLVMYVVNWGDGTPSNPNIVLGSGISINNKPNENNPHSFYHLYGYWDMLRKDYESNSIECGSDGELLPNSNVTCQGSACCVTSIGVKIKDNWGWCSLGTSRNDCDEAEEYNGYVVVNQYSN